MKKSTERVLSVRNRNLCANIAYKTFAIDP